MVLKMHTVLQRQSLALVYLFINIGHLFSCLSGMDLLLNAEVQLCFRWCEKKFIFLQLTSLALSMNIMWPTNYRTFLHTKHVSVAVFDVRCALYEIQQR